MKKSWWWIWTVVRPATLGDWLWRTFVIDLAAWLDHLTWRKIFAFLPLLILAIALAHHVPLPPEILLVGDTFAYFDALALLMLIAAFGRFKRIMEWGWIHALDMSGRATRGVRLVCRQARGRRRRRPAKPPARRPETEEGPAWAAAFG